MRRSSWEATSSATSWALVVVPLTSMMFRLTALPVSLASCFFRACLLGCYLSLTGFANSCQTLRFFAFFLSAQARESNVNGVIEHWLDLTSRVWVEIADLAQKGVTGIPRIFAGLV